MSEGSSHATRPLLTADTPRRRSNREEQEPPGRGAVARIIHVDPSHHRGLPHPDKTGEQRVRKLIQAAQGKKRALVLTHDNPDPDSMASAFGVAHLLETLAGVPTKLAYGGIVGRAENRALVRVLKLPLIPVSRIVFDEFDFIALVDTQPECRNHSLMPRFAADAVIDHHPARPTSYEATFADVGGDYGATASIVTSYVRATGITPSPALATALFYGIKSDTRDLGREFEPIDVENYEWLFPFVDHTALSQIEHPSVPATYFAAMHHAIEKARRHDEAVVADLDTVYAPDVVAEVADRLLTLEGMRWSLALGEYEGNVYLSVRTSDRRMNAGRLVREVVGEEGGSAGGHGSMAGGRLVLPTGGAKEAAQFKAKLIRTFLREFGAPMKGEPLV